MQASRELRSTEGRRDGTFSKQFRRVAVTGREPPSSADTDDSNGSFTPVRRAGRHQQKASPTWALSAAGETAKAPDG
jgi:hypothetical protein